ncbi:DUF982 domain-containing protein (plasmid) [Rhizobium sp. 32-5/1]|uniref:DUF982 domain-containing protein n=1 Tax=Rhizobium sp. 32-5/1 TaxID=3019602 RepID=UPI00240E911E|nr:DUF982 domain-containing protein [Rhizobium sp. 32-5/1]WEZ85618.1 DUF982 domain-containing protein [Rhizobium sp. 32-5/1]
MWNRTVTIELQGRGTIHVRNIRSTSEAAHCLLREWPVNSGNPFKQAIIGCKMALSGELPDTLARFPFQKAAREAGLTFSLSPDIAQHDQLVSEITEASAEMYAQYILEDQYV